MSENQKWSVMSENQKGSIEERIIGWGGCLLALLGITAVSALLFQVARADGKPDYCYISTVWGNNMPVFHQLHQHRPWRSDLVAGRFVSIDAAVEAAKKMECPLH